MKKGLFSLFDTFDVDLNQNKHYTAQNKLFLWNNLLEEQEFSVVLFS